MRQLVSLNSIIQSNSSLHEWCGVWTDSQAQQQCVTSRYFAKHKEWHRLFYFYELILTNLSSRIHSQALSCRFIEQHSTRHRDIE